MKKSKVILSFVLLFAITLQITGKLLVMANYTLNKEYITKAFCVNKKKATMHCNGKCHLKKQLKEQDKKENSSANPLKEIKEIQLYHPSSLSSAENTFAESTQHKAVFIYAASFSTQHLKAVFHPPALS